MSAPLGRTALIARVNEAFPTHWQWVVENNHPRPPEYNEIPQLLGVEVGEITHEYGTEAEVVAQFRGSNGSEYKLRGSYLENHHDQRTIFTSKGVGWGTVEESILNYLLCDLLYEEGGGREFEDWLKLPE